MNLTRVDDFLKEMTKDLGGPGSGYTKAAGHRGRPGEVGGSSKSGISQPQIKDTKGIYKVDKSTNKNGNAYFEIDGQLYFCPFGHPYAGIELEDQKVVKRINGTDRQTEVIDQLDAIRIKYHYDAIIIETKSINGDYLEMAQNLINEKLDTSRINDIQWGSVHQRDVQKVIPIDEFLGAQNIRELSLAELGGAGSGNYGHAGRPGQVGGSAPDNVTNEKYPKANPNGWDTMSQYMNKDGTWTKERQELHEEIIAKFFEGKTPVEHPQSYLMGGGPASGKTTILRSGQIEVPDNYVLAAGDDIKELLPEYEEGVKKGNSKISAFVHEESSYLSKVIASRAAKEKYNVLMDGTGDSGIDSLTKKVDSMRPHGQPVIGMYATIDIETAKARALSRAQKTGRYMPESVLVANHQAVSKIFPEIVESNIMDQVNLFDTSTNPPKLIAVGSNGALTVHDKDAYQKFLDKAK